jgi:signal transduction histidine kinase
VFGPLKPLKLAVSACSLIVPISSRVLAKGEFEESRSARFCHTWVIGLHFSLTRKTTLAYDFLNASFAKEVEALLPSVLSRISLMATVQKHIYVSEPAEAKTGAPLSPAPGEAVANPAELQRAYSELQERFQRTTNALGSAAHDLKTPLAILNGYVELLQSEKLGPLNDRQREVLRDMQSSGKRLQQFIQDFLTYSALETGGLKMQFEAGNINQCLSEVCRLWSTRFQEKGLALYFLANDKLPVFPFDSPKLERVISNLLENSFKFIPRGGTVWLHAEPHMWERRAAAQPASSGERRRQDTSQPNAVKVSVSDTGPGIPAEFHQEVFDDFFRLPGTENQEGMGLGLSIVRRLVLGMGGKVWVESDPGAGCKFSFLIPFKPSLNPVGKGKNR